MRRIMIVDNEPDIVYLVKKMLEKKGYEVTQASNGRECLQKINKEKPDLVLMDVIMPGIDGWEVARKLKRNNKTKNIPVAMFTIMNDEEHVKKSFEYARADEHIGKPFSRDEMLATIERVLQKKAAA